MRFSGLSVKALGRMLFRDSNRPHRCLNDRFLGLTQFYPIIYQKSGI